MKFTAPAACSMRSLRSAPCGHVDPVALGVCFLPLFYQMVGPYLRDSTISLTGVGSRSPERDR